MDDTLDRSSCTIGTDGLILVTGASGFIGLRVVDTLLRRGYRNLRCLVRPSGNLQSLEECIARHGALHDVDVMVGNLLSAADCHQATAGVEVIYHLAAGRSDMFADAFLNSVVSTRNLLRETAVHGCLVRFVNVSSFSVYTNRCKPKWRLLDETCPIESDPAARGDPYMFGKTKQEELLFDYGRQLGIPFVTVRPGVVYGEGNEAITNRVGIGTFGIFLHLGGSNSIPLTYVDNCADAIVLAGLKAGVDGETFNVVDDDLPSSRRFLRLYKRNVGRFWSIYVPHLFSYALCAMWERYSRWSEGQLPPVFTSKGWHAYWKKTEYSNAKLKQRLGWRQSVPTSEALRRYFASCRTKGHHA